jgi:flagellar hook-basal body complex protein FliE
MDEESADGIFYSEKREIVRRPTEGVDCDMDRSGFSIGGSLDKPLEASTPLLGKMRFGKSDAPVEGSAATAGGVLNGFGNALKAQMNSINSLQAQASAAQQTYATGGDIELHNVMLAMEKADLSMQLALQIRNKAVAAYQEISHMSV